MASGPLPSGGIAIIIVTTVFLFLAILAVIARFYSKRLQNRSVSIDDYLIIAGLVCISIFLYIVVILTLTPNYSNPLDIYYRYYRCGLLTYISAWIYQAVLN